MLVDLDIDGSGTAEVGTGLPFFDHMLDQLARHGGFDLKVLATGDLEVDGHHTVEDVGITLGRDVRRGARRQGRRGALRAAGCSRSTRRSSRSRSTCRAGRSSCGTCRSARCCRSARRRSTRRWPGTSGTRSPPRPPSRCTCASAPATTRTTSSKRRSRAWPGVCAPRCASRAEACRRRRARCDAERPLDRRPRLRHRQPAFGAEGAANTSARTRGSPPTSRSSATPPVSCCRASARSAAAWRRCERTGLASIAKETATGDVPFLGICIGMQLLYDESEENPGRPGLGVLPGTVRRLPRGVKHPQMQWNTLAVRNGSSLFARLPDPAWFYFVHSFAPDDLADAIGDLRLRRPVVAAVERGNVAAMQFHPEKSAANGLHVLAQLRGAVRRRDAVRPLSVDRSARRAVVRLHQGDFDRETVYGDDPSQSPRRSRPPARAGSMSSTSTPRVATARTASSSPRSRQRSMCRCRPAGACATGRCSTPGRSASSSAAPRSRSPTSCAAMARAMAGSRRRRSRPLGR